MFSVFANATVPSRAHAPLYPEHDMLRVTCGPHDVAKHARAWSRRMLTSLGHKGLFQSLSDKSKDVLMEGSRSAASALILQV